VLLLEPVLRGKEIMEPLALAAGVVAAAQDRRALVMLLLTVVLVVRV
jgi:hypothetical protein